jgi:hypothetical protein
VRQSFPPLKAPFKSDLDLSHFAKELAVSQLQVQSKHDPKHSRGEIFWFMGLYEFDVDLACELVQDGRESVELEEDDVRYSATGSHINKSHLPNVDPTRPGIIAHVRYETDDGRAYLGHVLIDGNHRAARCMAEKRPFEAYLLTPDESERVLLRGPADPIPPLQGCLLKEGDQYILLEGDTGKRRKIDETTYFLLKSADGNRTAKEIRAAYGELSGKSLSQEDFNIFVKRAQSRGWIRFSSRE